MRPLLALTLLLDADLLTLLLLARRYYGFYEHPRLASAYMLFNLVIGVTGMLVPWQAWFNEREYKNWRIAFFCSLALSAVGPVSHRAVIYGLGETVRFYSASLSPSFDAFLERARDADLDLLPQARPSPRSPPTASASPSTRSRCVSSSSRRPSRLTSAR